MVGVDAGQRVVLGGRDLQAFDRSITGRSARVQNGTSTSNVIGTAKAGEDAAIEAKKKVNRTARHSDAAQPSGK